MTTKLLEGWSPALDETAERLLKQAERYVPPEATNTGVIPILLAALTTSNIASHAILQEFIDSYSIAFIAYVKSKMNDSEYEDNLEIYKQACGEIAKEEDILISDALILWQIIEKSVAATLLFQTYGIDLHELQNALQEEVGIGQQRAPSGSLQPLREPIPPLVVPEIWRNISPVVLTDNVLRGSLKMIDPIMHTVTRGHLIDELEDIVGMQRNRVVLFAGPNGSVVSVLKYMLAYWIGQSEASIPPDPNVPEVLRGYKLWEVSIEHFRNFSRRRRIALDRLLEYLKEEAVHRRAILLLTGFENIRRESSVWARIRDVLSFSDGACIICSHVYADGIKPPDRELTLGSSNMIPVHAEQMAEKSIFDKFIDDYHRARWVARGYMIADDTFDSLFELERGIWISHRRKTWPYLGIDLVDNCISTAERGERAINYLARDAREAINNVLTREAYIVGEELREEFAATLKATQERIELLCQNPTLPQANNLTVVTQALIEAQLFCRNNSEFHYPGIRPW